MKNKESVINELDFIISRLENSKIKNIDEKINIQKKSHVIILTIYDLKEIQNKIDKLF